MRSARRLGSDTPFRMASFTAPNQVVFGLAHSCRTDAGQASMRNDCCRLPTDSRSWAGLLCHGPYADVGSIIWCRGWDKRTALGGDAKESLSVSPCGTE